MQLKVDISIGVWGFAIDLCLNTFITSFDQNIQERDKSFTLQFHGELDAASFAVQVAEELLQFVFTMWPNHKGIVYMPELKRWLQISLLEDHVFKKQPPTHCFNTTTMKLHLLHQEFQPFCHQDPIPQSKIYRCIRQL